MRDLFGNDHPEKVGALAPTHQTSLIDHAAEVAALASGRPVSQERAELVAPPGPLGSITRDENGVHLGEGYHELIGGGFAYLRGGLSAK